MRIRIELREQNDVQKYTSFNGFESVLGSGFKAFVLNCVFKTWFKNGRFGTDFNKLPHRRLAKLCPGSGLGTRLGAKLFNHCVQNNVQNWFKTVPFASFSAPGLEQSYSISVFKTLFKFGSKLLHLRRFRHLGLEQNYSITVFKTLHVLKN